MSLHKCNIWITTPGIPLKEKGFSNKNADWFWAKAAFTKHVGEIHTVDTCPGWWNLNQDWLEILNIDMNIEWADSSPTFFSTEEKDYLYKLLTDGKLLMMVERIEDKTTEAMI
jgi:hypothetical protein